VPVRPRYDRLKLGFHGQDGRSLFRYVFDVVEQRSTMALFTARADGGSATPAPQDFCKACSCTVFVMTPPR